MKIDLFDVKEFVDINKLQEITSVHLISFRLPYRIAILYRITANIGSKLITPIYVISENIIIKVIIRNNQ